eukprot:scaffold137860_cov23-Tisochrysis_lutea.AAC.1
MQPAHSGLLLDAAAVAAVGRVYWSCHWSRLRGGHTARHAPARPCKTCAALHRAQEHEQYFRWLTCRNCAVQQALLLPPHKRGKQTRSSSMTVPFARGVRVLHPAMYRCDTKDILQHILAKAGMGIYHCGHGSAQALNLL